MSSVIGRHEPRRFRRFVRALTVGVLPWLLSLLVHAGGMIGLGLMTSSTAISKPGHARSIELTLMASDGLAADGGFRQVVFEAASRAPALLPSPIQASPVPLESVHSRTEQDSSARGNVAAASYIAPVAIPTSPGPPHTTAQFFGLRAQGTRFVYVFDRSSSMEGRPLQAAKSELISSLAALSPRDRFQVVFYNDQPQIVPAFRGQEWLRADEPGKRLAAGFLGGILADGPTNHLPALLAALQLSPDVIFFLTDSQGLALHPQQLAYIRQVNRGAMIFTIEFGVGPRGLTPSFLERLAMENGGQHTYIDLSQLR